MQLRIRDQLMQDQSERLYDVGRQLHWRPVERYAVICVFGDLRLACPERVVRLLS
jgi:hypothetical protein